ncbi:hypothetical protein [Solibacillus sp. CAU 1738]|uniref:hypothetical protein n=1 Tax=Solibacillus sp. CAU 1738 TaxID=3140363 RepID=UPI003260E922
MRSRHLFKVILAFSILLMTGCSNNVIKEAEEIENEFPPSMAGLININGIEYPMEEGNYQWQRKTGLGIEVVQTDHASPYQMADHIKSISVKPSQKVDIQIEDTPQIKVYLWNDKGRGKEIEQDANQITVPSEKGKYIYEAIAEWPNGTVSYTFVIEIE